jgi:uncharacterized protein (DUF58 family)
MKGRRSLILYPPAGERLVSHRRWYNKWIPLLGWLWYFFAACVTLRLVLLWALAVVPSLGSYALFGTEGGADWIGAALISVTVVGFFAGWLARPRLKVEALSPLRVEQGEPAALRYRVTNRGRFAARDIRIDTLGFLRAVRISPAGIHLLPAGESALVTGECLAKERGRFRLPGLRWETSFPLGLWRWGRTSREERVLNVYPAYAVLDSFELPLGPRDSPDRLAGGRAVRAAIEFRGCREFHAGDSLRAIHPRSSARAGKPVIKEYQEEGRGRTAILVDTWLRREPLFSWQSKTTPVEAALSLTASIAERLSHDDHVLELLAAGPGVYRFESAGRIGYLEDVLDILAAVEYVRQDPLPRLAPILLDEIRAIQSVCLVFVNWNQARADFVTDLLSNGVGVRVFLIRPRRAGRPPNLPDDAVLLAAEDIFEEAAK